MRVYTLSDMRSKKQLRVYTASEAKGFKVVKTHNFNSQSSLLAMDGPGRADSFLVLTP